LELKESDAISKAEITLNTKSFDQSATTSIDASSVTIPSQDGTDVLINLRAKTQHQTSGEMKFQGSLDDVERQEQHHEMTVVYSRAILFPERIAI
jgi:ABC-type iron transport system FetAB ATPase subunit